MLLLYFELSISNMEKPNMMNFTFPIYKKKQKYIFGYIFW